MKKKTKVSKHLIALMCLGTAGLSGAASVVLLNQNGSPSNSQNIDPDKIDLSTFSVPLTEQFAGATEYSLLRSFAQQHSLTNTDDLEVEITNVVSRTFKVTTKPNSYYYVAGKYASCSWTLPETGIDWTTLYPEGANLISSLAIWEDTEIGRNEILADLAIHYNAIDMNQLYIDSNDFDQVTKSANIRVVEGSTLYNGALKGTVTAGFVQATQLSYDQQTLTQSVGTANGTFIYKGNALANNAAGLTWTISPATSSGITTFTSTGTNAGKLEYASAKSFLGAMYAITATYVDGNSITWKNTSYIYVQANNPYSLSNVTCNVSRINQSTQTATFTFNNGSAAAAVTSWAVSPTVTSTGLSFGGGTASTTTLKITTLKTTNVVGGTYTLTATYNGFKYNCSVYVENYYTSNVKEYFECDFDRVYGQGQWWGNPAKGNIYRDGMVIITLPYVRFNYLNSHVYTVLPDGYEWDGFPSGFGKHQNNATFVYVETGSGRNVSIWGNATDQYVDGTIYGKVKVTW